MLTWPRFDGPTSGPDFDADFRPPLAIAWKRELRMGRFNDGLRLGGDGRIVVTTGGTGITLLDSKTGEVVWEAQGFRFRQNAENLVCSFGKLLARRASRMEGGVYRGQLSVLDLAALRLEEREVGWTVDAVGTYERDGESWLVLNEGKVRLAPEPWEFVPWPKGFFAEAAQGARVIGQVLVMDPSDPNRILGRFRRCLDVRTGEELWARPMEGAAFRCTAITDRVVVAHCARAPLHEYRAYAIEDGRELWRSPIEKSMDVLHRCVPSGDRVYLPMARAIECRDALTGELVWRRELGPKYTREPWLGNPIGTRGFLWLLVPVNDEWIMSLVALDKETGEVAWKLRLRSQVPSIYLSFIDNALQWHEGRKIVCAVPETGTSAAEKPGGPETPQ